jgi:hypothetical protein
VTEISAELIRSYAPNPQHYRPDGWPAWIDEIDLSVTGSHVRMGTRSLAPPAWLLRDDLASSEMALRRRLLAEQRGLVFACTPVAEAAASETADLIGRWHVDRDGSADPSGGETHPLARAGMQVQEDLCIMVHHHGAWHLEGAVLCFPSMWSLAEKMGRPTSEIHAPVAHYAEELGQRVDTFFDRLALDKLVHRRNVSLWPACLLWVPTPSIPATLWDRPPAEAGVPILWVRSERQTLRRLPASGAILFTIRVQMAPLAVLARRPDRARDLAAWLRAPGGESRRRQLGSALQHDLTWLDQMAQVELD